MVVFGAEANIETVIIRDHLSREGGNHHRRMEETSSCNSHGTVVLKQLVSEVKKVKA